MNTPYEYHELRLGVKLSYVAYGKSRYKAHPDSLRLISYAAYEKRALRNPGFRLREGKGAGRDVLLAWECIPVKWQNALILKFGEAQAVKNPLEDYYELDPQARIYYSGATPESFRFDDDSFLSTEQIERYTINASVLKALDKLKQAREVERKMRGSSLRGLWPTLIEDVSNFNKVLIRTNGYVHTLPNSIKLKTKYADYKALGLLSLIDGRAKNTNAQVVTPEMLEIWRDIYAGQRGYKPDFTEVSQRYDQFLAGNIDIVMGDTGEIYDRKNEAFRPAARSTVYAHQSKWEIRVATQRKRAGDRQKYKVEFEPYHKLLRPEFAGSIISIDDRQPPFKMPDGNRMWFYNAIDLGSEAFTVWVHGKSKEGLILEFYRQMVRNYTAWGLKLPYELEAESSLNSSFKETFLKPGAMFSKVRIEANNARGKRIEAYYRPLRYKYEKKRIGWLARPHALSESNQASAIKVPRLPQDEIIQGCLRDIETWNNELHWDQANNPGMTRWDHFIDKQHPQLTPYNWPAILSGLGRRTESSMHAGRITLQGKHRVVGNYGTVATGDALINIMKQIEAQPVEVRWLDDNEGNVLKALVYTTKGQLVCELLGDLAYHRSELERTPQCAINRELTAAYTATVQQYARIGKASINNVTIIENEIDDKPKRFVMPGLAARIESVPAEVLSDAPRMPFEPDYKTLRSTRTSDRF